MAQRCNQSLSKEPGKNEPTKSLEAAFTQAVVAMVGNGHTICGAMATNCPDNRSCGFVVKSMEVVSWGMEDEGWVVEVIGNGDCECLDKDSF